MSKKQLISMVRPLSDAALLQAVFPVDDLPAEHRDDFHRALHGDPEMSQKLPQGVRDLLFRNFRTQDDASELEEHELEESDAEESDDVDSDDGELDDTSENETVGPVPGGQGEYITWPRVWTKLARRSCSRRW